MKATIVKADNGYVATTEDHTYIGITVANVLAKMRHEIDETISDFITCEGDSCYVEFSLSSVVKTSDE